MPPKVNIEQASILVYSANKAFGDEMRCLLEQLGVHEVTCISEGRFVGLHTDTRQYDILLLDVDGCDQQVLLPNIVNQVTRSVVSIVFVSSKVELSDVRSYYSQGAQDVLAKPVEDTDLQTVIQDCMSTRLKLSSSTGKAIVSSLETLRGYSETSQKHSSIETPIELVVKTISKLLYSNYSAQQQRLVLASILQSLGAQNLYRPDIDKSSTFNPWFTSDYLSALKEKTTSKTTPLDGRQDETKSSVESFVFPQKKYEEPIENLESFDFNIFDFTEDRMTSAFIDMLKEFELISHFRIDEGKLISFIKSVRQNYLPNKYHNFTHALDVTQFVFSCLHEPAVANTLNTPLDKLSALLAALCHDVGHPGYNNQFHVRTQSKEAILYNDRHVLENMHASLMFNILLKPRNAFLEHLSSEDYLTFREFVIEAILDTDPARHFEILAKFNARIKTGPLKGDDKEDKKQLISLIVKSADISNVARPFELAKTWAERVVQEFVDQGDRERDMGLSVTPLLDRKLMDKSKLQISFIGFFALPLFNAVGEAFPNLKWLADRIETNKARWEEIKSIEEHSGIRPRYDIVEEVPPEPKPKNLIIGERLPYAQVIANVSGIHALILTENTDSIDACKPLLVERGFRCLFETDVDSCIQVVTSSTVPFDIVVIEEGNFNLNPLLSLLQERSTPVLYCGSNDDNVPQPITQYAQKPMLSEDFLKHTINCVNAALENAPIIDEKAFEEIKKRDPQYTALLVSEFVNQSKHTLENLDEMIHNSQFTHARLSASGLKLSAMSLGLKPLMFAAFDLERMTIDGNVNECAAKLLVLKRRFSEFESWNDQQRSK